ncbi:bifunctional metallophosphatase/5'-nucleotidase [Anaerosphaera multitolerans]|uniref:Bifunctional metallophosphatase/5'-nucleotidase n=1 Tax=Anaerosphaera multitolerans TaxID=2487351 RepID=A0A437S699_9FIRM|nr:5'-nucleotidase C-terminal domain-containing protein [Anaerosphaera multitolerans]RVU54539.1 bifunctional metallophosphatase/5'-nucleotidase [Anaerosphaera multitolerans]
MKVNIYASSDVHGHIYPYDYAKNIPLDYSLAHLYDCYKKDKNKYKILVDNGDIIQGNSAEYFIDTTPNPIVKVMNFMDYKIWNMGNHEFNFSYPRLKKIIKDFKGTALMANSNSNFFYKYKTINLEDIKISFIGINTLLINYFEKEESLAGLVIEDPIAILNQLLNKLSKTSNVIIGMFHLGLEDENSIVNSGLYSILNNIENPQLFDVIICGHTHKSISQLFHKDILITQPAAYTKTISKIEMDFSKGVLISKNSSAINLAEFKASEEILKLYEPYHKKILEYTHEIIGYVKGIKREFNYDFEDNPLNHLLTKIMLKFSKADVVAFQIDNKEALLKNGPLRRCDLAELYSYDGGEVTTYKMKGIDLKKYILWSYDYFNYKDGKVSVNEKRADFKYKTLDVFGNIHYTIDLREKSENRLKELKYLNGKDILDSDEITVGMNEYRMNFLISKEGPLAGKTFEKISSSKYIDENFNKRGTIRELAKYYFEDLPNNTYYYNDESYFYIKY